MSPLTKPRLKGCCGNGGKYGHIQRFAKLTEEIPYREEISQEPPRASSNSVSWRNRIATEALIISSLLWAQQKVARLFQQTPIKESSSYADIGNSIRCDKDEKMQLEGILNAHTSEGPKRAAGSRLNPEQKHEIISDRKAQDRVDISPEAQRRLSKVKQRIARGFYDSSSVVDDISDKLSGVLDDLDE